VRKKLGPANNLRVSQRVRSMNGIIICMGSLHVPDRSKGSHLQDSAGSKEQRCEYLRTARAHLTGLSREAWSRNLTPLCSKYPYEKSGPMQQRYVRCVELVSTLGFAGHQSLWVRHRHVRKPGPAVAPGHAALSLPVDRLARLPFRTHMVTCGSQQQLEACSRQLERTWLGGQLPQQQPAAHVSPQ
jgi:hypothetical protein